MLCAIIAPLPAKADEGFLSGVTPAAESAARTSEPLSGSLLVRAIAPGAGVSMDGQPAFQNLILASPGEYNIQLDVKIDGADPQQRQLEIRGGHISRIKLSPKPRRPVETEAGHGKLPGQPAVVVFNLAPTPLVVTPSQEDPKGQGWKEFPAWMKGAIIYSQSTGAGPGAVADVRVRRGGIVYVACHYGYEGNASGGWKQERLTEEQMVEQG